MFFRPLDNEVFRIDIGRQGSYKSLPGLDPFVNLGSRSGHSLGFGAQGPELVLIWRPLDDWRWLLTERLMLLPLGRRLAAARHRILDPTGEEEHRDQRNEYCDPND